MPPSPANPLDAPVATLSGVGAERAALLARLGIRSVSELLLHRPRRHEDRRRISPISGLVEKEWATARGRIVAQGIKHWRGGARSTFEFILEDGTARLHCRWWNLPYMEKYFRVGDDVVVHGKTISLRPRTMDHPETEIVETEKVEAEDDPFLHVNRIVPIYPLTEGVAQRWLRALVWRALAAHGEAIPEPWPAIPVGAGEGPEKGDPKTKPGRSEGLDSRAWAIRTIHFPERLGDVERARQRLALDEFLELQLEIQRRRLNLQAGAAGLPCAGDNRWMRPFLRHLGFRLSDAQARVLREIRRDLGDGRQPMRRLLQGDVGSGKTVVAACAALMTLESGFDAALMAPTAILADQHYRTFHSWFEPLGIGVELRTGTGTRTTGGLDSSAIHPQPSAIDPPSSTDIQAGSGGAGRRLYVGTHALIERGFDPGNLGLVIIDEQHKFGVAQRERLVRKGRYPHLLVMTATPIPRTLGLTVYGDLDISVIDRLPAGRGRVRTFVRGSDRLPQVFEFIRKKLGEGRQVYAVYPRVEESVEGEVKAVTCEWERLRQALAPFQVGLLHGRLKAAEAESVMASFRENRLQVLVATSIVEVGVDVPNATVMLVENAERFGLAQLHQLRGRIGRGSHESWCVLVADLKNEEARRRLEILEQTGDGFRVAEEDLRLRGPGELLGREQSGLPSFRFGDLAHDGELVERARRRAAVILGQKSPKKPLGLSKVPVKVSA